MKSKIEMYLRTLKARGGWFRVFSLFITLVIAHDASKYHSVAASLLVSLCVVEFVFEGYMFFHTDYYEKTSQAWKTALYYHVRIFELVLNIASLAAILWVISIYGLRF